jgi:hypothetical protein
MKKVEEAGSLAYYYHLLVTVGFVRSRLRDDMGAGVIVPRGGVFGLM